MALQLSYEEAGSRFKTLNSIVVDEWHELSGSKRGVLFELGLARLRKIAPGARIWGPVGDDWQSRGGYGDAPGSQATRSLDRGTRLQADGCRDRIAATDRTFRVGRPLGNCHN